MTTQNQDFDMALHKAWEALRQNRPREARRWAEQAARLDSQREEPWLVLAALAAPRASLAYVDKALQINPHSQAARKGRHWAIQRLRKENPNTIPETIPVLPRLSTAAITRNKPAYLPLLAIALLLVLGIILWFGSPYFLVSTQGAGAGFPAAALALVKPSLTPTATDTPTATLTPTQTASPTITPTETPTALHTETPIPTEAISAPIDDTANEETSASLPNGVSKKQRWIDVDLTNQRVYVFEGKKQLKTFIVSTGTWQHPTVTGQYNIYVKYQYADMSGPGYYLPNVPYVMYFYQGYGLHGTYWHSNFGTPMSHGCVNLRTDDAAWLFDWASVGTLVNVHY
jgi:lipoprotein-anchoring transpeptidase ErfK/SrfK